MSQPDPAKERAALLSSLNDQREHVPGILEGLPSEALRTPPRRGGPVSCSAAGGSTICGRSCCT